MIDISYPSQDDFMGNLADAHKRIEKALDQIREAKQKLSSLEGAYVDWPEVLSILERLEQTLTGRPDV
jgi:hypothetical protein